MAGEDASEIPSLMSLLLLIVVKSSFDRRQRIDD